MGRQDPAARRVSNLSSSQIERKRAIDRANQQHCQQRKKARLQWLETEVARLGSELDVAHAKIRDFEEACTCGRYHSPRADSQPHQQSYGLQSLDLDLHRLPSPQDEPASSSSACRVPRSLSIGDVSLPPESPSASSLDRSMSIFSSAPGSSRAAAFMDDAWTVRLGDLLDPAQQHDYLGSIVFEYTLPSPGTPADAADGSDAADSVPEWAAVPLHVAPETDIDRLISGLANAGRRLQEQKHEQRHDQQQRGADGSSPSEELSQAQFLSISSLLNPNLADDGSKLPTVDMLAHVVQRSTIRSVPTRIALLYILSHLMRWLVCRSKQTYDRLPAFLRPTLLQRTVAHPAWVDVLPWPEARDSIIHGKTWQDVSFSDFRLVAGRGMSVNWPCSDSGALLDIGLDTGDGQSQHLTLSPVFEQHIRCAENWTLGKSAAVLFPFLKDACVGDAEAD